MNRLEKDRPCILPVDKFSFKEVVRSAGSPHVIIFFIMHFFHTTMASGYSFFLPSIVKQLGFSRDATQLLSAGPFAAGAFGENRSKRGISPSLFTYSSSFSTFRILVGSLPIKRYYSGSCLHARRCWFCSFSM